MNTTMRWMVVVLMAVTVAQAQIRDDLGPDGLKLRGDGSVDDTQPGLVGGGVDVPDVRGDGSPEDSPGDDLVGHPENHIIKEDERSVTEDGTQVRQRRDVHVNPVTGVQREKTETRERNPDGSETRVRTMTFTDASGEVILQTTRTREKEARGERGNGRADDDSTSPDDDIRPDGLKLRGSGSVDDTQPGVERAAVERVERVERAERTDRPERTERAERSERAERAERVDRVERTERTDRPERSERTERTDRPERTERTERSERSDRSER